jgi:hypothetical protein
MRGRQRRLEAHVAPVAAEVEERRRAEAAMTPATREARAELERLEYDGTIEPWQAAQLRSIFSEIEGVIVEYQAKMAEALQLAGEQTADVAKARREEQRRLTTREKIAKWNEEKYLSRSKMDARQKSWIIRTFGLPAYNSLRP